MWTVNFQMFKLDLEKAEEPEIKLPRSTGSSKKQKSSRKTSTSALLTMPKPLTVWNTTDCGKFLKRWIPGYLTYLLRTLYAGQEATELDMEQQTGSKNRERSMSRLYIITLLIWLICRVLMRNAGVDEPQAGNKITGKDISMTSGKVSDTCMTPLLWQKANN